MAATIAAAARRLSINAMATSSLSEKIKPVPEMPIVPLPAS
jgi:hypothetical protein